MSRANPIRLECKDLMLIVVSTSEQLELMCLCVCLYVLFFSVCVSLSDGPGEARSVLQEQTTALGLAMFSLLVRRCTELLKDTPTGETLAAPTGYETQAHR